MNKSKLAFFVFFIFASLVLAGNPAIGGGLRHEYLMKGQVLEVKGDEAYVCIGSSEGAKEGQEFPVYRYIKSPENILTEKRLSYKREQVGEVKISRIEDEHFAWATVISGDVKANDSAEVKPQK
jgi:hypothetical protein